MPIDPTDSSTRDLHGHDDSSREALRAARTEVAAAIAEFNRELHAFARIVGLTPALLDGLPMPTLLLLTTMRLFKLLSFKIRELDARAAVASGATRHTPSNLIPPDDLPLP